MTTLNVYRAEGSLESPIILNKLSSREFDNPADALSEMEYDIKLLKGTGAEIKHEGIDRAYVIDESNNVSKIFDIE